MCSAILRKRAGGCTKGEAKRSEGARHTADMKEQIVGKIDESREQ
jgi:hypothetical protein